MKLFKKIAGFSLLASVLLLILAPHALAQSVLDDIKSKLEGEGITVVDYSNPEDAWGSLPLEWISYLSENYNNLSDLAADFQDHFIGEGSLTALQRQLAIAAAAKSPLTDQEDIEDKNLEIRDLNIEIFEKEKEVKEDILNLVEDNLNTEVDLADLLEAIRNNLEETVTLETEIQTREAELSGEIPLIKQEIDNLGRDLRSLETQFSDNDGDIVNLLFNEIDFYFNYSKWGRLPLRIIGILEEETDFQSLQDMVNLNNGLSTQEDITALEDFLRSLEMTTDNEVVLTLSNDDIELIIESTAILMSAGEAQVNLIGRAIANTIKNLAGALAVIWIIIAAARMIFAQGDENIITEQRRSITYGVLGLIVILLIDRLIEAIYGAPGIVRTELIKDQGFSNEVYGVINFIKAVIGTVAILFIVISGIRMIFAQGDEDQITKQRKAVINIVIGLILIAIDEIIIDNLFVIPTQQSDQIRSSNITSIINTFGTVLQFILGFVGLIAFGMLVYGAATMIMNYGNDEMVDKSKKIIRNAIIGILVVLSAYTIVATLVVFR